jgi:hypothetical protein
MHATPSPITPDFFAPPCPKCREPLVGMVASGEGYCGGCATHLEFVLFPARQRAKPVARAARSVEGDATCYFHAQNQAVVACDDCGRYLCSVCELPGEGGAGRYCPSCVAAARKTKPVKADEIVVYDQAVLMLAALPLLMWFMTLLTAPLTLALAIYGWRKPRSLVRKGNWRFFVGGLIALLQIGGWVAAAVMLWLK